MRWEIAHTISCDREKHTRLRNNEWQSHSIPQQNRLPASEHGCWSWSWTGDRRRRRCRPSINSQFHWSKRHRIKWLLHDTWYEIFAVSTQQQHEWSSNIRENMRPGALIQFPFFYDYHFILLTFYLKFSIDFVAIVHAAHLKRQRIVEFNPMNVNRSQSVSCESGNTHVNVRYQGRVSKGNRRKTSSICNIALHFKCIYIPRRWKTKKYRMVQSVANRKRNLDESKREPQQPTHLIEEMKSLWASPCAAGARAHPFKCSVLMLSGSETTFSRLLVIRHYKKATTPAASASNEWIVKHETGKIPSARKKKTAKWKPKTNRQTGGGAAGACDSAFCCEIVKSRLIHSYNDNKRRAERREE